VFGRGKLIIITTLAWLGLTHGLIIIVPGNLFRASVCVNEPRVLHRNILKTRTQ